MLVDGWNCCWSTFPPVSESWSVREGHINLLALRWGAGGEGVCPQMGVPTSQKFCFTMNIFLFLLAQMIKNGKQ